MYSDEEKNKRFEQVCLRIEQGEPLRRILRSEDAPMSQTVFYELLQNPDKNVRYAHACTIRTELKFESIEQDYLEEPQRDPETGRIDPAWVNLQRLKIDAKKWELSKLLPKKYGDRIEVDQKTEATITWKEEKTYVTKNNETHD